MRNLFKRLTSLSSVPVFYNLIRDFIWAYINLKNYGLDLGRIVDSKTQFCAQWLYPTLGMNLIFICHKKLTHLSVFSLASSQKAAISLLSASVSIPVWNKAGEYGKKWAETKWGLSTALSGYVAAPFCGLADGVTQELANSLLSLIYFAEERSLFKSNPQFYCRNFAIKMSLGATFGAIPGMVWQVIAQACQTHDVNLILSILSIALATATCSLAYSKLPELIINCRSEEAEEKEDEDAAVLIVSNPYILLPQENYSINTIPSKDLSLLRRANF